MMCSLSHASASSECACAGLPKCARCGGVALSGEESRAEERDHLGSVDACHADVDRVSD